MFEDALLAKLNTDATLIALLSTYNTKPSIFSGSAPENVAFNYVVFYITCDGDDYAVDSFNVAINVFGYSESSKTVRDAVNRIIILLDGARLTNTPLDNVRLRRLGYTYVENQDTRAQQYNIRFSARAGRKGWMATLT